MRVVAFWVWIFINLAFLGMGGYVYLILSTYWCKEPRYAHIQPILHKKVKFDRENQVIFYEPIITPAKQATKEISKETEFLRKNVHTQFILKRLSRTRRRSLNKKPCESSQVECNSVNETKIEKFKNRLFIQLRRVLHEESNVFKTDNPYFVNYKGPRRRHQGLKSDEVKCMLMKAKLRLLTKEDAPIDDLSFGDLLGEGTFLNGKHYKTCALVSSAGSLIDSKLGSLIGKLKRIDSVTWLCSPTTKATLVESNAHRNLLKDSPSATKYSKSSDVMSSEKLTDEHEIVVRFNHAPTKSYEHDVGSKTTIRLVNSQVVSKPEFQFTTSSLYKNITLVVWDPSNYSSSLQQWYEKPDYNFFELWARQKILNSNNNSFILDPRSVWKVWDFIQSLTSMRIRRNPPSTGFLGLVLLMPYCDIIDFFEFVPSMRLTKRCHYFDSIQDDSCTFGVWHPLSAEKMLSLAMNEVNDSVVFETGFIRIKGYKDLKC